MKQKLLIAIILGFIFVLSGCRRGSKQEAVKRDGTRIGVIQTQTQEDKTKLDIYDENCKWLKSENYSIGGVGRYGFGSSQVLDGVVYDIAVGNDYKEDYGAVVGLDLYTGEVKEYNFGRVSLVDLRVTKENIYTISNIDGKTYIDRYHFASKKMDSFCWDREPMTDFAVSDTEKIYFSNVDGILYSLQFDENKAERIGDIRDYLGKEAVLSYMHAVGDKLYISLNSSEIMVYDSSTKKIRLLDLELDSGGLIINDENYLYVASADLVNSLSDGFIVKLNLDTEEIVARWDFDVDIYQFEISKDSVYILSYNDLELRQYSIEGDKLDYKNSVTIEKEYFLSGMGCTR